MLTKGMGRAVVLLLLPLLNGCLFTVPMWEAAHQRVVREPRFEGVLSPADEPSGQPHLVVKYYGGEIHDRYYVTIPLTAEGSPPPPYVYDGSLRNVREIAEALPATQRKQIFAAPMAFHGYDWGERLKSDPRYRPWSWATDVSVSYDHDYARPTTLPASADPCVSDEAGVRIRAIRLGRPWTDDERAAWKSSRALPADADVLVLPYARPRPTRDRNAAIARATLLTPVTLVGDVVVIPVLFVGCYVFGQCP